MMDEKYRTKICDFGEAKVISGLNKNTITKDFKKMYHERCHDEKCHSEDDVSEIVEDDPFEDLFELPKRAPDESFTQTESENSSS